MSRALTRTSRNTAVCNVVAILVPIFCLFSRESDKTFVAHIPKLLPEMPFRRFNFQNFAVKGANYILVGFLLWNSLAFRVQRNCIEFFVHFTACYKKIMVRD
jgi:hypothetical protein